MSILSQLFILCVLLVSAKADTDFLFYDRYGNVFNVEPEYLFQTPYFNTYYETIFVVHGFKANYLTDYIVNLKNALLKNTYANVILVDWGEKSDGEIFGYKRVANNTKLVAQQTCNYIKSSKLNPYSVYCVGAGLGAHICGFVGKCLNGTLNRITGLDPAGMTFDFAPASDRLDHQDAKFVDIIHSSIDYGIKIPIGTVDFYPNGGHNQPGCSQRFCDTQRAVDYFAESTNYYYRFTSVECLNVDFTFGICSQFSTYPTNISPMGYYAKKTSGVFFLKTNAKAPFAQS